MFRTRDADHLPHRTLTALLLVFAAVAGPHVAHLPPWITAIILAVLAFRGWIGWRGGRLPPTAALLVAAGLGAGAVGLQYGTLFGRDAGVALLALMTALKLLETRGRRDTMIVVFLIYFLMLTHFLFDQSLVTAAYMIAAAWATTSLLVAIGRRGAAHLGRAEMRHAGVLLAQALPVMGLLFVLFPRLPQPLWGLPDDAFGATSGLSDTMAPGAISQLSRSDAVAFRVRFDGEAPPPGARYWRAMVMPEYDGRQWSRADVEADPAPVQATGASVAYEVTVEPHNRRWLFALDLPANDPRRGSLTFFHELRSDEPVHEAVRYRARSFLDYRLEPNLAERQRQAYTRLPDDRHPRARALARDWRDQADTDAAVVERALGYFRGQPFTYTLSPRALRGDTVDGFLFGTREGFCEHFAGAFTVLMRAAGIPARVVTGYQGAELSATGDYWIVRQSDAHAWSEVWLPGEGWRRIDPTAAVSPDRVELGLGASVPAGDPVPTMASSDGGWIRDMRLAWDAVDAQWTQWVIGYGAERQQELLERLGLEDTMAVVSAMAGGLVGFMALLAAAMLWQQTGRPERDPVRREWRRAVRRLAREGLDQHPGEGPRDYAERVASARPALAADVRTLARHYIRLRYYPRPKGDELQALRRAASRLRGHRR